MSRTYKDRPYKHSEYAKERDLACYRRVEEYDDYTLYYWVWDDSFKRKKRKEVDHEYHWMSTPGYWTRAMMNRPQRRAGRIWECDTVKINNLEELEVIDTPSVGRKPHVYFW